MHDFQTELSNINKSTFPAICPATSKFTKNKQKNNSFHYHVRFTKHSIKKKAFYSKYAVHSPFPLPMELWIQSEYESTPITRLDQYWWSNFGLTNINKKLVEIYISLSTSIKGENSLRLPGPSQSVLAGVIKTGVQWHVWFFQLVHLKTIQYQPFVFFKSLYSCAELELWRKKHAS